MADKPPQDNNPASQAPKPDELPAYGDDMNSTMMAIDVAKFKLDQTRTGVQIPVNVERKTEAPAPGWRGALAKIWKMLTATSDEGVGRLKKRLPAFLSRFEGSWICDPNASVISQAAFYALRALIVTVCLACQTILAGGITRGLEIEHPSRNLFILVTGAQAVLLFVAVVLRASPGWAATLPLAVLSVIMAYGALFYHTADPLYFTVSGAPISFILNDFYFYCLAFGLIVGVSVIGRNWMGRIFWAVLFFLCLAPVAVNYVPSPDILLEYSFFGAGLLRLLPAPYFQPVYISLHALMPLTFLALTGFSLGFGGDVRKKASRGMARSLSVLMLALIGLNLALMQKNRVFHALNPVFPKTLHVGGIEVKILNQDLRIETRNFGENEGVDRKARYKFRIEKARDKNKFAMRVEDAFGFPVKYLTRDDLRVVSDGVELKDYGLTEDETGDLQSGRYTLELKLTEKEPPVKWTTDRQALKPDDVFALKLTDPAKVKKLVVRRDEDILLEIVSPADKTVHLPLNYFQAGAHQLEVNLYDELGQETFHEKLQLSIKLENDFALLSPIAGDAVGDNAGIMLQLRGIARETVRGVTYLVDGVPVHEAMGMNYYHTLDLADHADGETRLTVKLKHSDKEIFHEVVVVKKSDPVKLVIDSPKMGVFAERDMPVELRLSDAAKQIKSAKVLVNGLPFTDFAVDKNAFTLPVTRWEESEIYLAVQSEIDDGAFASDWVQINRGLSVLELKFDIKSLNFLNVNRVAVLLDASVSSLDNWQGKSKWYTMSNVVLAPEVESRLKNFNPTFVAFGGEKPYYFKDCDDAKIIGKGASYNKASLKRKLEDITPKGASALIAGLKLAYNQKPEKVFVFADSADTCRSALLSALKPVFAKSPQTVINVFVLGGVGEGRGQLMQLAEKTGGRYSQPSDYDSLIKAWLEELSLRFELYSGDKAVFQSPLEDKEFKLGPGEYTLKIPYGNQIKEVKLKLEHGTKTTLSITGKTQGRDGKEQVIGVEQKVDQL